MSVEKVLRFGNATKATNPRPTVLVVSPAGFTNHLKDALLAENKQQYSDKFEYFFCEHMEDFLAWTPSNRLSGVDYIVVALDPRESACITMAEDNLSKIDSMYIKSGRLCLVNGACSIKPTESVPQGHIYTLSQKYSVMIINGDVLIPEKCIHLTSRISRLVSVVTGLHTGVSMSVDLPGYF